MPAASNAKILAVEFANVYTWTENFLGHISILMWIYNGSEFTSEMIGDHYGFVYAITCLPTDQKYIGKKFFWSKRTLPPLKGKTRKRHIKKESDWKEYRSSSKIVHALIDTHGVDNFSFEILSLHPNKAETNYAELRYQIILDVLDSRMENGERKYLNENIERRYYPSEKFGRDRVDHHQLILASS